MLCKHSHQQGRRHILSRIIAAISFGWPVIVAGDILLVYFPPRTCLTMHVKLNKVVGTPALSFSTRQTDTTETGLMCYAT